MPFTSTNQSELKGDRRGALHRAGTMIGSHVNDSGFWVTTQMFALDTKQGLKYKSLVGAFCGVVIFIILAAVNTIGLLG